MTTPRLTLYLIVILALGGLYSCTKELNMDDDIALRINKQEKMERLDELYDLSFENPFDSEEAYRKFIIHDLLTENQNYLEDSDIKWRNARTDLAIRMNAHFARISADLPTTLFELYKTKFETNVLNRTLLGQSPQQLKSEARFTLFKERLEKINSFFDDKINSLQSSLQIDSKLPNSDWLLQNKIVGGTPDNPYGLYIVNFDFKLQPDGGMAIKKFFFFPYIPKPNASFYTQQDEQQYSTGTFVKEDLMTPAHYKTYGNKILFHFHLKNNVDPFTAGIGKPEREWVFEYEYSIKNKQLLLTKPRMILSMYPHLLKAEPGDDIYLKYYSDRLKEFTLTIN